MVDDKPGRLAAFRAALASPLGLFQAATILALITAVPLVALLVRHFTDDYFIPAGSYLQSIKIAAPPVVLLTATYALSFLTGTPVSDIPKTILSFVRNVYFQSKAWMTTTIVAAIGCGIALAVVNRTVTPPSYMSLVQLILSGGSDDLALAREKVDTIRRSNPRMAAELGKVVEVFRERSQVNGGGRSLSGDRARTFVRALEAEAPAWWQDHPLRKHALGEAYLLYGQAVQRAAATASGELASRRNLPFERAVDLYRSVAAHPGPLAPAQLRISAQNNVGNAHYYMGQYQSALEAWKRANSETSGRTNLNSWGNIVAALVLLDRPGDALAEGERARLWAERTGRALVDTFAFAGVLENTGFARMQLGDLSGGMEDMAAAHAFREDDLTRQNLAIALILNRRLDRAREVLRQIVAPIAVEGAKISASDGRIARCVYLLWALALRDGPRPPRAANFMAFLGEVHGASELGHLDDSDEDGLARRVAEALPRADEPCRSLGRINALVELLRPRTALPTLPNVNVVVGP